MTDSYCVFVCCDRACKKQGALTVLQAFNTLNLSEWKIISSHCMGQCGNGPMVRVQPGDIWYWRVQSAEVAAIVDRHLVAGNPIRAMLYPVVHKNAKSTS